MLANLLLDALFPDACLACLAPAEAGARHAIACDRCLAECGETETFSCLTCGSTSFTIPPSCHWQAPARLTLGPEGHRVIGSLASALRFGHVSRAAEPLAELLAASAIAAGLPLHRAVVAPVPEPPWLARERGYAANLALARSLAPMLGIPAVPDLLAVFGTDIPTYGLGAPGDAASARLVILASVGTLPRSQASRCADLIRAACFSPSIALLACTA